MRGFFAFARQNFGALKSDFSVSWTVLHKYLLFEPFGLWQCVIDSCLYRLRDYSRCIHDLHGYSQVCWFSRVTSEIQKLLYSQFRVLQWNKGRKRLRIKAHWVDSGGYQAPTSKHSLRMEWSLIHPKLTTENRMETVWGKRVQLIVGYRYERGR